MAVAKTTLEHGDRVERNGVKATVIHVHDVAVTVLPDQAQRSEGSQLWAKRDCVTLSRTLGCPRCGERHPIWNCPEGK